MNFSKIVDLFKSKVVWIMIFSIIGFFLFSDISFAEATGGAGTPVDNDAGIKTMITLLQSIAKVLASLLGVITAFVSVFLHPSWVNGSLFGLDEQFKTIWILISNVVYFIFALIIIAIAFMNIIGKGEGNFELKQALPKFVIGVFIVPVSWFFIQLILSISAILTVSVLTLPFDTFKDNDFFKKSLENQKTQICTEIKIKLGGNGGETSGGSTGGQTSGSLPSFLECKKYVSLNEYFNGKNGNGGVKDSIFGIISIYTYGVMDIGNLDVLTGDSLTKPGAIVDIADLLVNKLGFDFLFFIVYLILMVALFMALLVRGIYLWLYTMFSPVFGLLYFLGKSESGVMDGKFSVTEFIKLAMVPVLVSAALAFGLVFLFVVGNSISTNKGEVVDTTKNTIDFAGFKLEVVGPEPTKSDKQFLGVGGFLGVTILKLFGIAVLWMSVMTALGYSKVLNNVVKPIQDFGSSVGNLMLDAPKYIPIIPAPGGPVSAEALRTFGSNISQIPASKANEQGVKLASMFNPSGATKAEVGGKLNNITSNAYDNPKILSDELSKVIPSMLNGNISNLNSDDFRNTLNKIDDSLKAKMTDTIYNKDADGKYVLKPDLSDLSDTDIGKILAGLNKGLANGNSTGFLGATNQTYQQIMDNITSSKTKENTTASPSSVETQNVSNIPKVEKVENKTSTVNITTTQGIKKEIDLTNITKDNATQKLDSISSLLNGLQPSEKKKVLEKILEQAGINNPEIDIEKIVESMDSSSQ